MSDEPRPPAVMCLEIAESISSGKLTIADGALAILKFSHDRESAASLSMAAAIMNRRPLKCPS